jgi:uncharacterized protein YjbI with pentapeptide repeats
MRRKNPKVTTHGGFEISIEPDADLSFLRLDSLNLNDADLQRALLVSSELGYTQLQDANLAGADLTAANLYHTNLNGAHLENAILGSAQLRQTKLNGAHLEGANLNQAKISGAELTDAHLEGAYLQNAQLFNTQLNDANLDGAHLEGAKFNRVWFTRASLRGAFLNGANLRELCFFEDTDLTGADLTDADIRAANLSKANLTGAILTGVKINYNTKFPKGFNAIQYIPNYYADQNLRAADFRGKDLENASFFRSDLEGAHLEGANLKNADFHAANLKSANFVGANLEGAKWDGATLNFAILEFVHLEGAKFGASDLIAARLNGAHLDGADLESSDLSGAKLVGAHLTGALLNAASLKLANLTDADLSHADLKEANLFNAVFRGAILEDANLAGVDDARYADFTDANLTNAALEDADLSKAILTGAILAGATVNEYTKLPEGFDRNRLLPVVEERRSYREMTGSVLKLGKPDSPQRAADFKRKYPAEFDRLIKDTGGKDFTDAVKDQVRDKYRTPFDWYVTHARYRSEAQRKSEKSNDVILLNVDLEKINVSDKRLELLKRLSNVSHRSGHPHAKYPLFTIGWIRFHSDKDRKLYLVEEVQSDVWVVRQQTKNVDNQTQTQLRRAGISPEDFNEVYETLRPYSDRFYEDALGILFMEAEQKGYSVEMLGYEDKREFASPRSVYTDLPRKMGMRPQPTQTDLGLKDKVSYYKPNPSHPRRRY